MYAIQNDCDIRQVKIKTGLLEVNTVVELLITAPSNKFNFPWNCNMTIIIGNFLCEEE